MENLDTVNHPEHYNKGRIEVIEVIDDWQLDFYLGNAVKYIGRANHKNNAKEDLKKAIWYLERKIKLLDINDSGEYFKRLLGRR